MPVWRRRADAGHARGIGKGEAGRALLGDQAECCLQQRLFQVPVVIAALGAALFLAPAHVKDFYMSRAQRSLERFRAKWTPVRAKKTRQIKNLELRFDSNRNGAL